MGLTIELTPDLETELRRKAEQAGVEPQAFAVRALRQVLAKPPTPPSLSADESALLQQINLGFQEEWWERYSALIARRQAESVSPAELNELIEMSDRVEAANVRRMRALVELARLRGKTLDEVMDDLGITPPPYV